MTNLSAAETGTEKKKQIHLKDDGNPSVGETADLSP